MSVTGPFRPATARANWGGFDTDVFSTWRMTWNFFRPDLAAGEVPQAIVPAQAWQAAEGTGDWTLVGCTVAPGFDFAKFELAEPDWFPGR